MKKVYRYLTSMQFGLILLGIIIVVSLVGSVIPQNNEAMYYVRNYPNLYNVIFALKLNSVFTSWYFLLLVILLCLNLAVCTYRQLKQSAVHSEVPSSFTPEIPFEQGDEERVRSMLGEMKCKAETNGEVTRYTGKEAGRYGSFLLHFGILLTAVFWALGMAVPKIMDQTCYPGEAIRLEDGTAIRVDSFSIEDNTGRLDYASDIEITLPDGRTSGVRRVSVNHPVSMGDYKVYQQTYGTAGKITVTDAEGHSDSFYVDPQDFLSADGENGIWFDNLYPGYKQDETGALTLVTSTSGHYENPVYVFVLRNNGESEQMLAFPGDTVEVGKLTFTFDTPVEYPGLRIKRSPAVLNLFLLLSVILLTAGLYLIFFLRPIEVLVSQSGCKVIGRNEGLRLSLKHLLSKGEE